MLQNLYIKKINTSFVIIGEREDDKTFNNIKSLIDTKLLNMMIQEKIYMIILKMHMQ